MKAFPAPSVLDAQSAVALPRPLDLDSELFALTDDALAEVARSGHVPHHADMPTPVAEPDDAAQHEITRLYGTIAALKEILKRRETSASVVSTRLRITEQQNRELRLQLEAARRAGLELSRRLLDCDAALNERDLALQRAEDGAHRLKQDLAWLRQELTTVTADLHHAEARCRQTADAANEKLDAQGKEIEVLQTIRQVEREEAEAKIRALTEQLKSERAARYAAQRSSTVLRDEIMAVLPTLKAAAGSRT